MQTNITRIARTIQSPLCNTLLLECKTYHPSILKNDTLRDTILIFIVNFLKLLYELKDVLVAYATTKRGLENPRSERKDEPTLWVSRNSGSFCYVQVL